MAAPADVADRIHALQRLAQPRLQARAIGRDLPDQAFARDDLLHRDARRAGGGVGGEGVPGAEGAVRIADHLPDRRGTERRAQRKISTGQALGDAHDIRRDPVMVQRDPGAAAPRAAHHLVRDHQDAVARADVAHRLRIAGRRGHAAPRRAHHGFEDEPRDGFGARAQDRLLQRRGGGRSGRILGRAGDRAIGIRGRYLDRGQERPLEGPRAFGKARQAQRAQRVAMPGPLAADEGAAREIPLRVMVLQRDLQAAFHRFGPAADEDHLGHRAARAVADDLGQLLQRVGGEVVAIAMRDAVQLVADRAVHLGVRVPDAIDRRSARSVDILLATGVPEIGPLRPRHLGQRVCRRNGVVPGGSGHVGSPAGETGVTAARRPPRVPRPAPRNCAASP